MFKNAKNLFLSSQVVKTNKLLTFFLIFFYISAKKKFYHRNIDWNQISFYRNVETYDFLTHTENNNLLLFFFIMTIQHQIEINFSVIDWGFCVRVLINESRSPYWVTRRGSRGKGDGLGGDRPVSITDISSDYTNHTPINFCLNTLRPRPSFWGWTQSRLPLYYLGL